MKSFKGRVLFLDRADINTDEIIPAKYLTETIKEALRPFLLEELRLDGFDPRRDLAGKAVIVTRSNFGCGSSREHAPWALEANGINLVVAPDFARIFRGNMYNCGMMALELPAETIDRLFLEYAKGGAEMEADVASGTLTVRGGGKEETIPFKLDGFDRALVDAGGWVSYADSRY